MNTASSSGVEQENHKFNYTRPTKCRCFALHGAGFLATNFTPAGLPTPKGKDAELLNPTTFCTKTKTSARSLHAASKQATARCQAGGIIDLKLC